MSKREQAVPRRCKVYAARGVNVCRVIILCMLSLKLAPALAAGNTVVLKPAETLCLSVLEFMKEMADIIPPGVVNECHFHSHTRKS